MVIEERYDCPYPTVCTENSVYLFKQSVFNNGGDANIPMYRHEISFNLPYPDYAYIGYHIESEYRMTLDKLNVYETASRISSFLEEQQSASLTLIWEYLISQNTKKNANVSASNTDRDTTNALDLVVVGEEEEEEEENINTINELENFDQSAIGITITPIPTITPPVPTVHMNGRDLIFHTHLYLISTDSSRRVLPYQDSNNIARREPELQHTHHRDEDTESKVSPSIGRGGNIYNPTCTCVYLCILYLHFYITNRY